MTIDMYTTLHYTWKILKNNFSSAWIKDSKMEDLKKNHDELNEAKKNLSNLYKDNENLKKILQIRVVSSPRCKSLSCSYLKIKTR